MSCNFLLFYSGVAVFMICSGVEAFMFFAAHAARIEYDDASVRGSTPGSTPVVLGGAFNVW